MKQLPQVLRRCLLLARVRPRDTSVRPSERTRSSHSVQLLVLTLQGLGDLRIRQSSSRRDRKESPKSGLSLCGVPVQAFPFNHRSYSSSSWIRKGLVPPLRSSSLSASSVNYSSSYDRLTCTNHSSLTQTRLASFSSWPLCLSLVSFS